MRKFVLSGVTGLLLAFGATGVDAQSLLARPSSSPYALLNQAQAAPVLTEGRSAFTGDNTPRWTSHGGGPLKNSGPVTQQLDTFGGH